MRLHVFKRIGMISLLLVLISACSAKSEEDTIHTTRETVKEVFNSNDRYETAEEVENTNIYLPGRLEVIEEDENNIILKDHDQMYIVFNNKLESSTSELNYQSVVNSDALLLESLIDQDKFGYVRVMPEENEEYELQVGVGGIKITTNTSIKKMNDDAEILMKMVLSTLGRE